MCRDRTPRISPPPFSSLPSDRVPHLPRPHATRGRPQSRSPLARTAPPLLFPFSLSFFPSSSFLFLFLFSFFPSPFFIFLSFPPFLPSLPAPEHRRARPSSPRVQA